MLVLFYLVWAKVLGKSVKQKASSLQYSNMLLLVDQNNDLLSTSGGGWVQNFKD